jgi:hypothetical protein
LWRDQLIAPLRVTYDIQTEPAVSSSVTETRGRIWLRGNVVQVFIDNATKARYYQPMAPYTLPNLPAALEAAGHTWRNYADARASYFDHIVGLVTHKWNVPSSAFDLDAEAGRLPDVAWVRGHVGVVRLHSTPSAWRADDCADISGVVRSAKHSYGRTYLRSFPVTRSLIAIHSTSGRG